MVSKGLGVVKLIAAVAIFAAASFSTFAENQITTELTAMMVGYKTDDGSFDFTSIAFGELTILSKGNRNVKAGLELSVNSAFPIPVSIDRLYMKTRFPDTVLTIGKTRLSWGQGFAFNSGDLLFGATDLDVDLSKAELRTQSNWLLSAKYSFDRFVYIEGVVLPEVIDPLQSMFEQALGIPLDKEALTIEKTDIGARFVTKAAGLDLEAAYLYTGNEDTHRTALSIFLPWEVDIYATCRLDIPTAITNWSDAENSLTITGGLFANLPSPDGQSLSARIETIARPYSLWSMGSSGENNYGLFLYPEIMWSPEANTSITLRSLFSPIDTSALVAGQINWNVYEGFSVLLDTSIQIGELGEVFSFETAKGLSLSIGTNFIF